MMKTNWMLALLFLVGSELRGNPTPQPTSNPEVATAIPPPPLTGDKAIQHLRATGQYESLGAALTAARYAVHPAEPGGSRGDEAQTAAPPTAAKAANAAQGIVSTFTPEGLRLQVRAAGDTEAPVLVCEWRLASVGYGEEQIAVPPGELRVEGQRAEIIRGGAAIPPSESRVPHLAEWFVNTPGGLEHGFTLHERPRRSRGNEAHSSSPLPASTLTLGSDQSLLTSAPTAEADEPLRLIVAVNGDLAPHADVGGQRLNLRDGDGHTVLSYEKLKVWDAAGVELRATMSTGAGQVLLSVDDTHAHYPLTIDPTFVQQAYLKPAEVGTSQARDYFGESVAISGDTVVVGALLESSSTIGVNSSPNESGNETGAAYVFVRSAGVWTQQAYLKPVEVGILLRYGHFGASVAITGDTVVVGAPGNFGRAYIFVRSAGVWTQQAYLKPAGITDPSADAFGTSVDISGDTVVVGSPLEDSIPDELNDNDGAAYVFVRNGGDWTRQAHLKPAAVGTSQVGDLFGTSVAISGNTVVVGSPREDSSTTGVNSMPDENSDDAGAAYVFVRSGGVWTQQAYLKPAAVGTLQLGDSFGTSVALSGDTVVVGAPGENSITTGVNSTPDENTNDAGAAYIFVRSGGVWKQQAYLKPAAFGTLRLGDSFGTSVALSGDTVVVGAPGENSITTGVNSTPDEGAASAGAAYVFVGSAGVWTQHAYLKPAAVGLYQSYDGFGWSVAISGDTVVVGALQEDSSTTGVNSSPNENAQDAGAAYVFVVHPSGGIITRANPPGPIRVGENLTVTFAINGYLAPEEIDRVNFRVSWPEEQFSFVPGSLRINDAGGENEHWLRRPPQDSVGAGPLPIGVFAVPAIPGRLDVSLRDSRPAPFSVRGTRAEDGFLVSFTLHADAPGAGFIQPSALPFNVSSPESTAVLVDPAGRPAGVPGFTGAPFTVIAANAGQIVGQVDMLGETETAVRSRLVPTTQVTAQNGPGAASGSVLVPYPYHGAFALGGLPPSSETLPVQAYEVGVTMHFGLGRQLETFTSPWLGRGPNLTPATLVPDSGTLDLGNIFVMNPGYVEGQIFLRGPDESLLGHLSPLRGIMRATDRDLDLDRLPDLNPDGDSRVSVRGTGSRAAGANFATVGGEAFASFAGDYWDAADGFEGSYRLALAGLNGEAGLWQDLGLNLVLSAGDPAVPETFVHQKLLLAEQRYPGGTVGTLLVRPGDHQAVDLNYCFSEVVLEIEANNGLLWSPRVEAFNSGLNPSGPPSADFLGHPRQYSVQIESTKGTPVFSGDRARRGRIVMLLPEGNYDLEVTADVTRPDLTEEQQTWRINDLKVGCGERILASSGARVEITSAPECGGGIVRIEGQVINPDGRPLSRVEWSTPDGGPTTLCDDLLHACGPSPLFSFLLPTATACVDTPFTVTAHFADGETAVLSSVVPKDVIPPTLTVGADKTVECGSDWGFDPATAADNCGGEVPVQIISTVETPINACDRIVTRTFRAVDACGNVGERAQRITVVDTTSPIVFAPDIEVDCPQTVFYSVASTDNCGAPLGNFDPPNGSFFGPGVTRVAFTSTDPCGRTTAGSFNVTVRAECALRYYASVPIIPEGGAEMEARADGSMRIRDLGETGLDGLRFEFGDAEAVRVDFDTFVRANQMTAGGLFTTTVFGEAGATLATLRLQRNETFAVLETIPDFSSLGSSNFGVRLYRGTQLIHESLERTAPPANQFPLMDQLFLSAQPTAIRAEVRPGLGLVFESYFTGGDGVQIYRNGSSVNLNPTRMEIFAGPGAAIGPSCLAGLSLRFSGLTERIVTGIALTKFGQEIRGSQGVSLTGIRDQLAVRTQPLPPDYPWPDSPEPTSRFPWNLENPIGYFGDFLAGNPSRYRGYWEERNPLGFAGDWDLRIDLTDSASQALGVTVFRPGKSGAELKVIVPMFGPGGELRVVAGGVMDALPGALTVDMGSLVFRRSGSVVELGAEYPRDPCNSTGSAQQRLEVTLSNGGTRTLEGAAGELRVSWDAAVIGSSNILAAIRPDGRLALGVRADRPGPIDIRLPDGSPATVTSLQWTPACASFPPWAPGSLRGLLLVGENIPGVFIQGLTTSTVNPRPTSLFAGRSLHALGHASFRHDAFGALQLSGLSPSGADGVELAYPAGEGNNREVAVVNLGPLGVDAQRIPKSGAHLDFRVQPIGNSGQYPAELIGQNVSDGGPYLFWPRFAGLGATRLTLRILEDDSVRFEQTGQPIGSPNSPGNLVPREPPHRVAARLMDGKFAWVMSWNRAIIIDLDSRVWRANRVEFIAEDALPFPSTSGTLELRASQLNTLRLVNLGDRSLPSIAEAGVVHLNNGRPSFDWTPISAGDPRLQVASSIDGPWRNAGLGNLVNGRRMFDFDLNASQEVARLVPLGTSEGCLDFSREAIGERANPWEFSEWKFERFNSTGGPTAQIEVVEREGVKGLIFDGRLEIELPALAAAVDVGFIQFGGPVKFEALDEAGQVDEVFTPERTRVDRTETLTLEMLPGRPIRYLRITGAGKPVQVRELCLRSVEYDHVQRTRACLPLRTAEVGEVPNPWVQGDLIFTAFDQNNAVLPAGRISPDDGAASTLVGYEVEHHVELRFEHPCPRIEVEFTSHSGQIEFQPFDELGAPLTPYRLNRVTAASGEIAILSGDPRPIARLLITTPNDRTRLLQICCGPVPVPFCRVLTNLAATPLRNPQPVGDTLWTFYDPAGGLASSAFVTVGSETGLQLTRETLIEFATEHPSVELRLVVGPGDAILSAEAMADGGRSAASLPETTYSEGIHDLVLTDYCSTGCGGTIRQVRLKLTSGKAMVSRLCTPTAAD